MPSFQFAKIVRFNLTWVIVSGKENVIGQVVISMFVDTIWNMYGDSSHHACQSSQTSFTLMKKTFMMMMVWMKLVGICQWNLMTDRMMFMVHIIQDGCPLALGWDTWGVTIGWNGSVFLYSIKVVKGTPHDPRHRPSSSDPWESHQLFFSLSRQLFLWICWLQKMLWCDSKMVWQSWHFWGTLLITKTQLLRVVKTTARAHKLTREEKFQVFVRVCDNMLAEGRITQKQHRSWTNIFWSSWQLVLASFLQDDSILSVYHHWDGYPSGWVGFSTLVEGESAELIDGGDMLCMDKRPDW